ncbi:hypothetical protein ACS0PU_005838 [Formica fusca]
MKKTYVIWIGIVILIMAMEVLLIYSTTAYSNSKISTTRTTLSSTKSTSPSETITIDRTTTMPATQSKMPTHSTMPSIPSTTLSTTQKCITQKCITSTQLSSTEMISSDSTITNAKEITTDTSETMPNTVTTIFPTISTTLVTNGTTSVSKIPTDISINPPIVTSEAISATTVETNRTTITTTTIKDIMTNTTAPETTLTKESSTISTPMPTPKCTANTMHCTTYIALEFDYIVRDIETGVACILTNMVIQIAMKGFQIDNVTLTVPTNAKTTGICDEKIAKMTLSWEEPVDSQVDGNNKKNRITFHYAHNETKFFLDFISINVHLDGNNFPRARKKRMRGDTADRHLQLFSASINNELFICKVNTTINIGNEIEVVISNIRLIAFNKCIQNCSKTETDCIAETNVNIDAVVGAVFIGILILILIIRKCRSRRTNSIKDSKDTTNYFLSCKKIVLKKWHT